MHWWNLFLSKTKTIILNNSIILYTTIHTNIHEILLHFSFVCITTYIILKIIKNNIATFSSSARAFLTMGTHEKKNQTSSCGGLSFNISIISMILFNAFDKISTILFFSSLINGLFGCIDDYEKIKKKNGLSVKKKFFIHMTFALVISIILFNNTYNDIHFFFITIKNTFFYIPWAILIIISTCHAVNISDGIDGLVASSSITLLSFFSLFFAETFTYTFPFITTLSIFYFFFNKHKASVFMGDIGAFFIGGYISTLFLLQKKEWLLIPFCALYVLNTSSVIIQHIYFKITKKRFFLFAPYHHTLEKKGWSENNICLLGICVTCIGCIIGTLLFINYY